MTKIDILIVVLAFLFSCIIAEKEAEKSEITVNIYDNENPRLQRVNVIKLTSDKEIKDSQYKWGERQSNDRIVANRSDSFTYESFQDISLLFQYPDSTNQRDTVTYVSIEFSTDSPYDLIFKDMSGLVLQTPFRLVVDAKHLTYLKYDFKLYGN
ncbi:unnamed protein product [Diamesa serratosioi]